MTIYPGLKYMKKLFGFYDGLINDLVAKGFEKTDAVYSVNHFLEVFILDPDSYRIRVDETDDLVCVTTNPKTYLNKHLTIPIGKRDFFGLPVYKVVKLKEEFKVKKNEQGTTNKNNPKCSP